LLPSERIDKWQEEAMHVVLDLQGGILVIDLEIEATVTMVDLEIARRSGDLNRFMRIKNLNSRFQAQAGIILEIYQTMKFTLLVGGAWAVFMRGKKRSFSVRKSCIVDMQ
jgi:hypothetical protein